MPLGFSQGLGETKYIPMDLSTPFCRLNGHRSIVNSVLFHPQLLHIVTAGIEKDVILHSPTPGSPCTHDLAETSTEVRNLSDRPDEDRLNYWLSLTGELGEGDSDEEGTISTFDQYVLSFFFLLLLPSLAWCGLWKKFGPDVYSLSISFFSYR